MDDEYLEDSSVQETVTLIYQHPNKIGHAIGFVDLTDLHSEWIREMVSERKIIRSKAIAVLLNHLPWLSE